jgi:hypothetical protein
VGRHHPLNKLQTDNRITGVHRQDRPDEYHYTQKDNRIGRKKTYHDGTTDQAVGGSFPETKRRTRKHQEDAVDSRSPGQHDMHDEGTDAKDGGIGGPEEN